MTKHYQPMLKLMVFSTFLGLLFFSFGFSKKVAQDSPPSTENKILSSSYPSKDKPAFFQANTLDGTRIEESQLKDKIIILDFFATWCPPCIAEIPHFVDLQTSYAEDVQIVGVSLDKTKTPLDGFIRKHQVNYPIIHIDGQEYVMKEYGEIRSIPTTFILNKNLEVVDKVVGYKPKEYFEDKILSLK